MTVKVTILTHTMTHMQNNTVNRRLVLAGIGGLGAGRGDAHAGDQHIGLVGKRWLS